MIFSIISTVVNSTGRSEFDASSVLVRYFSNSESHCLTVEYHGEKSFSVESVFFNKLPSVY